MIMTAVNISEIKSLIAYLEQQTGRKYETPTDFEQLAMDIFFKTKSPISVSTLKRLWGYVQQRKQVRKSTLDILANYCGWVNFERFRAGLSKEQHSGFLNTEVLLSADLMPGTMIEVGWEPNRLCRLIYQGDNYYELSYVENSKLKVGTIFRSAILSLGHPLYLEEVLDESKEEKVYIAGKNSGLTILKLINDK